MFNFEKSMKIAGLLIAIIGGSTFFLDKYFEKKKEAREHSLNIVEKFNEKILNSKDYRNFWLTNAHLLNKKILSERELILFFSSIIKKYKYRYELTHSVIDISNSFDNMEFCIFSKICNEEIIMRGICRKGVQYFDVLPSLIAVLEEQYSVDPLAFGVRAISKRCEAYCAGGRSLGCARSPTADG